VVKNRAKDGTPYYVDAVIAPILGENGKPMKYLGVRYDITEAEIERQNARGILGAIDQSYAYIEFDLGGHVLNANATSCRPWATARRDQGQAPPHVRRPGRGQRQPAYAQFWRDLNAGKAQNDLPRITKAGSRDLDPGGLRAGQGRDGPRRQDRQDRHRRDRRGAGQRRCCARRWSRPRS
jgi:methyl-accepting chemotaxis protein